MSDLRESSHPTPVRTGIHRDRVQREERVHPVMLYVDERIGSKDLLVPLQRYGVPCELQHLPFADVAFIGRGMNDSDVYIGIELKETQDLLSCMESKRFSGHQLPGLITTYDRAWLLTEGIWRAGPEGVLETHRGTWKPASHGRRRVMATDLDAWILSQTIRGGISYWHAPTRTDTIRFLATLYRWWTSKAFEDHRSHAAIYLPPPDRASCVEPSTFLKMLSCIPGVGWQTAQKIDTHCAGSISTLISMSSHELQAIDGIGAVTSAAIFSAMH